MKNSKDDVSAACNDYLKVLGLIALAYSWIKVLDISYKELSKNKKYDLNLLSNKRRRWCKKLLWPTMAISNGGWFGNA